MIVVAFILIAVAMVLNCIALGAMYWAAGMYFGWTLVLSVTVALLHIRPATAAAMIPEKVP